MITPPFIFLPNLFDDKPLGPLRTFKPPEEIDQTSSHPVPPVEERLKHKPFYKYGINCDEYIKFTKYVYDNYGPIKKFLSRLNLAKSFGFPKLGQKILDLTSVTEEQVKRLGDLSDANTDYYFYTYGGKDIRGSGWSRSEAGNAIHKYIRELKLNSTDIQKQITEMLNKEDEWIKFYQSKTEDEMENE